VWERERERESSFLVATETTVNGLCVPCLLTYLLTYSMEQTTSSEANRFSVSLEIPLILWNRKVHYRIHKCPPPVPTLSQINPVQSAHPTSCGSILILSSYLRLGLTSCLFSLRFLHQNPVYTSPHPHTCYLLCPSHSSQFYHPINIRSGIQIIKLLITQFSPFPC